MKHSESVELQSNLNRLVADAGARLDVLTTAMALAHSRVVSLPSAPLASPSGYYNTQVSPMIDECLCACNERIPFDLKCARNEARQFWMMRYGIAHAATLPVSSTIGFVDSIAGAGIYLDRDLICFANEHQEAILRLCNDIQAMLLASRAKDQDREVA